MTALLAPHQSPNMSNYSQEETRAKLSKLANAGCLLCSLVAAASLFLEAINRHGSNVDEEKIHPGCCNIQRIFFQTMMWNFPPYYNAIYMRELPI